MISIPGSFSFAKLAMMLSAPAKSAGDARYASIHSLLSLAISTPICIRSAFFLRRTQQMGMINMDCNMDKDDKLSFVNAVIQRSRIAVLNYSKTKLLVIFNGVKLDKLGLHHKYLFLVRTVKILGTCLYVLLCFLFLWPGSGICRIWEPP